MSAKISYEPLFKTLEEKKMMLFDVQRELNLSPTIIARFRKNERVSLETIERICILLKVPIEKVVQVIYK